MARVKLIDVARRAGVSVTAVSFFLNGKAERYNLSAESCRRIEEAIRETGYIPNLYARSLSSGKTRLIALSLPGRINGSFWSEVVAAANRTLAQHHYQLLLSTSCQSVADERNALLFLQSKSVDGCLIQPMCEQGNYPNAAVLRSWGESGTPVVCLNCLVPGVASVSNDEEEGGRMAARFLWERGHRHVAFRGNAWSSESLRYRAFQNDFVKKLGGSVVFCSAWQELIALKREISAVFCYSDYELMQLYGKIAQTGIAVGHDWEVVGFDGMDFLKYLTPSPWSIYQQKKELGERAAHLLLRFLDGEPYASEHQKLLPSLRQAVPVTLI